MIRQITCDICKLEFGKIYVESVWESNDDKTFKLLHFICSSCNTVEVSGTEGNK